ncbi:hypothetical protein CDN99_25640 [Roseateles aquatilis]|uniref:Methyltransferase n=1 Tax=Roseateles aquatilis TaxID=431061 RepID=A0A246IUD7_9BURK|nr:hypothetical protein [Roseateles aquatilis]OWQ83851.1 hypothetical protein CDN99_25640 [Roseateles aquatilis]
MNKQIVRGLVVAGVLGASGMAHAASGDPDISAVTAAAASIAIVGVAVFAVKVGMRVWKWMAGAL